MSGCGVEREGMKRATSDLSSLEQPERIRQHVSQVLENTVLKTMAVLNINVNT